MANRRISFRLGDGDALRPELLSSFKSPKHTLKLDCNTVVDEKVWLRVVLWFFFYHSSLSTLFYMIYCVFLRDKFYSFWGFSPVSRSVCRVKTLLDSRLLLVSLWDDNLLFCIWHIHGEFLLVLWSLWWRKDFGPVCSRCSRAERPSSLCGLAFKSLSSWVQPKVLIGFMLFEAEGPSWRYTCSDNRETISVFSREKQQALWKSLKNPTTNYGD